MAELFLYFLGFTLLVVAGSSIAVRWRSPHSQWRRAVKRKAKEERRLARRPK